MDNLAAPIVRRFSPFDPAVGLQTVEQTDQRGLFDPHPFGDFLLRELISAAGNIHQGGPMPLAQPERPEALIEPRPPGTRRAEEDDAEFIDGRRWHQESLAC